MEKYNIVATIGFTSDFILRRVFDLGKEKVNEIIPVALETDKDSKDRIEKTFSSIEAVIKALGIKLHPLEFIKLDDGISKGREILIKASKEHPIDLFLTGGPRILITIMILSALTLPRYIVERVNITSYGEAFEGKLSINAGKITSFISLDEIDKKILTSLKDLEGESEKGVSGLKIVKHTRIPKSTVYKKLNDLREKGLIKSINREWKLEEDIKKLF